MSGQFFGGASQSLIGGVWISYYLLSRLTCRLLGNSSTSRSLSALCSLFLRQDLKVVSGLFSTTPQCLLWIEPGTQKVLLASRENGMKSVSKKDWLLSDHSTNRIKRPPCRKRSPQFLQMTWNALHSGWDLQGSPYVFWYWHTLDAGLSFRKVSVAGVCCNDWRIANMPQVIKREQGLLAWQSAYILHHKASSNSHCVGPSYASGRAIIYSF